MERGELTRRIREEALRLGFDAVGVARAEAVPGERLREWLRRGYHGRMDYMARNPEKRLDPEAVLPGARSVLCLAMNYLHPYPLPYSQPDRAVISRYASGRDYHRVLQRRLQCLLRFVQRMRPGTRGRFYVDTGPMLDKYWAAKAGLGWLGKHTNLLSRRLGSWFFLGEILLDIELEYDQPVTDHCGSCRRCLDACPTQALVEPYLLDSRRCISYLTIELREDIPEELRSPMGNLVFGCDICQDVCPWNRKAPPSRQEDFAPRPENRSPSLAELARLSEEEYRGRFRGSAVKRARWNGFLRNVAVAMGNAQDPKLLPELRHLLRSSDPMVRRHAAWALWKLGGREARGALQEHLHWEKDETTIRSVKDLLSRPELPGS